MIRAIQREPKQANNKGHRAAAIDFDFPPPQLPPLRCIRLFTKHFIGKEITLTIGAYRSKGFPMLWTQIHNRAEWLKYR